MTFTMHYTTSMTAMIYTADGDSFEHPFYKYMTMQDGAEWALGALERNTLAIPSKMISGIIFIDSETGEALMEFSN